MAKRSKKPCRRIGCGILIESGKEYCKKHSRKKTTYQKMYTHEWSRARKQYLSKNPLCVKCKEIGIIKAAYVVDHIIPHQGNKKLFWDINNWQSLCETCHNKKTREEMK